jgi:hypothetical protein
MLTCDELGRVMTVAREAAAACTPGSAGPPQCETGVPDQCGCPFRVALPESAATTAYIAARDHFTSAGCATVCPALPCMAIITPGQCTLATAANVYTCGP